MSDDLFSSWKKLFISATNGVIQFVKLLLVINHNLMVSTVIQNLKIKDRIQATSITHQP